MKELFYFFDFLSPFSYFSWIWWVKNISLLKAKGLKIHILPVPLAPVIKHYETKGPAEISSKRNFLFKTCLRMAKEQGLKFTCPDSLPFNSQNALRMSLREHFSDIDEQIKFIDLLFKECWEQGHNLGNYDRLKELLGEKYAFLLEKEGERESRKSLKENIQLALNKGVFGVPSFCIDDELFWGNDSLKYLEFYLAGKDLLDLEEYQKFTKIFSS